MSGAGAVPRLHAFRRAFERPGEPAGRVDSFRKAWGALLGTLLRRHPRITVAPPPPADEKRPARSLCGAFLPDEADAGGSAAPPRRSFLRVPPSATRPRSGDQ